MRRPKRTSSMESPAARRRRDGGRYTFNRGARRREPEEGTMDGLHSSDAGWTLDFLAAMQLISACERMQVNAVLADGLLEPSLELAETIHLHIKLVDTARIPAAALQGAGGVVDHAREGFVKYRMPGRVNAI